LEFLLVAWVKWFQIRMPDARHEIFLDVLRKKRVVTILARNNRATAEF
jgi:hypothetical protein